MAPQTEVPEAPWPPPWARSVAFLTGIGLMVWETVIDQAAHLVVYGPAFVLTGLPVAKGLEHFLDWIAAQRGGASK
jgi:hypothetical protein